MITSHVGSSSAFHRLLLIFQTILKKFRDDLQKPPKGSHVLRRFSQTNHFFPKHSLQTWSVSRIQPYELPKLNEQVYFTFYITQYLIYEQSNYVICKSSKFEVEFFPTWGHDTTQLAKQMTNDTSDNSHCDQSSQYTKSDPTKPRESINRRRTRYKPEYHKFFLLVFPQEKLCK